MYQLTFKLKQHTPIIHFQHNQDGATLRVSEVKPKLDRFIIEKLGNGNYAAGIEVAKNNAWLIDKEKGALNYKMRIESTGNKLFENLIDIETQFNNEIKKDVFIKGKDGSFPTFFGNMMKVSEFKNGKEFKKFSFNHGAILNISSIDKELYDFIEKNISSFFETNNFGTRQSKGFGSFTIETSSISLTKSYLEFDFPDNKKIENIFKVINYYHLRLKSGVNFSFYNKNEKKQLCHYKEAFIKIFLRKNSILYEWDKRWMKEKFFPITTNTADKRFVRALLGLSYDFKFTSKNNPCNKTPNNPTRASFNLSLDNNNEIQRIQSPIVYKPIIVNNKCRIYILIDDRYLLNALNKRFTFNSDQNPAVSDSIFTPSSPLDYSKLISDYHTELGKRFNAYEFNMKYIIVDVK